MEFLFEILHEKDEPLISIIELFKASLKLREYYLLMKKENVQSYLELESYKELTLLKEIKVNHIQLMRSKRRICKLKGFETSSNDSVEELDGKEVSQVMESLEIQEPG